MSKKKAHGTVKIKVVPQSRGMEAPYQIIEVSNREKNPVEKAENLVRSKSRLSQLKNWNFYGEKI